jgi:2'-hydroxyisoflavone reductase
VSEDQAVRVLILGGTVFLGRAVARHARDAGHDVTCVARGSSGDAVAGVRFLTADRDRPDTLSILDGEEFAAVIDVTRRPGHARAAVRALAGRVGHWSYVSSISVYADHSTPGGRAETTPLLDPAPPETDGADETGELYGARKVTCEQVVRDGIGPDRSMICRAGLIVGPEDPSGRFAYWVARMARGGRVLAPGSPDDAVQIVDVRDLAAWLVAAGERHITGAFDATGAVVTRGECLRQVAAGVGAEPSLTWVDQEFLLAHEVPPWSGKGSLPLWLPLPDYAGMFSRHVGPALASGLSTRPLAETAADTLAWLTTAPDAPQPDGLAAGDEAALLREWDARPGT